MLSRLNKAKVPFGHLDFFAAWQGTKDGDANLFHSVADQRFVTRRRDAVKYDSCKLHVRAHLRES